MNETGPIEFTRIDERLIARAAAVIQLADTRDKTIVTAESCTGGLLASVLSDAPRAGTRLQGGFVTYTKEQKSVALGIAPDLLERASAVCPAVTHAMTQGALSASAADVAVAITGVARPAPPHGGHPRLL